MAKYLLAIQLKNIDQKQACSELEELLAESEFYSRELANIRRIEVCPQYSPSEKEENEIRAKGYLKNEFIQVSLKKAVVTGREDLEMKLSYEAALSQLRKSEKVKLLQRALFLAKKNFQSALITQYQNALFKAAPRLNPNLTKEDWMAAANDFRQAREFKKSRELYTKVIQDKSKSVDEKSQALESIAKTHKLEGNKKENIQALRKWASYNEINWKLKRVPVQKMTEAWVQVARAEWTEQLTQDAIKTIEQLEMKAKGLGVLDQAYWVRARIDEESGDYKSAINWLDLALKEKFISSSIKENIGWQKAWLLKKLGDLVAAREELKANALVAGSSFTRTKYNYWYAVLSEKTGEVDAANEAFDNVIKSDPFSYYALLAKRFLKKPIQSKDYVLKRTTSSQIPTGFDRTFFIWLLDVNETTIARNYLDSFLSNDPTADSLLLTEMAEAGLYNRMYAELSSMVVDERNKFIGENLEFFFPRPFFDEYQTEANKAGVDVNIMLAITRQESAFDPFARSPADAFGLMQVLPQVAEIYAQKYGIKYQTAEDLYKPEINLPIGANLILNQFDRFLGSFIPAIASYNASESAVRNWIKTRYKNDAVEFIEEIPYEETKAYVKLVMRNYVFYKMLTAPNGTVDFPENVLSIEN